MTPVVQTHLIRSVDGQQLVRVHGHQHRADVRLIIKRNRNRTEVNELSHEITEALRKIK